ncbi:MAG: sugar isomerase domain-containing protein [Spirochaetaceae bacterium]|nr:MAG: sugar isomerase domain-containing protein [Spirochaetaceae bacterium]
MGTIEMYFTRIMELLDRIVKEQQVNIDRAAAEIVKRIKQDRLVYVIGTGAHSMMVAMEMFKRAGGISQISPLFPPGLGDFEGHPKTERLIGYAALALDYYKVEKGDVLIIANVNGINALTIDCALECRRRGITSIAITSSVFSDGVEKDIPARHPSNKNLCDIADIVVEAYVPPGDALLEIEGADVPVGPGSTYPMVFIANSIVLRVIEMQIEQGMKPEVRKSGNLKGGLERSKTLFDPKYYQRIKHY